MRVCVFCGSRPGRRPEYAQAASAVGQLLAENGHGIVFGGGDKGLMGSLAKAAAAAGGEVIGVVPDGIFGHVRTVPRTEVRVVPGMHARKVVMYDLAAAFLVLPGGFGTFDEVFEALAWAQLGLLPKPIVLLDIADYFKPLKALLDHAIAEGFATEQERTLLCVCRTTGEILGALQDGELPPPPPTVTIPT